MLDVWLKYSRVEADRSTDSGSGGWAPAWSFSESGHWKRDRSWTALFASQSCAWSGVKASSFGTQHKMSVADALPTRVLTKRILTPA